MPIIKKSDFAEKDLLADVNKQLKDTQKLVVSLTESNKKLAESFDLIKKTNDGKEAKALTESINKLKKSTSELTDIQKQELRLTKQLKDANSDSIQKNEEIRLQLAKQKKANKELAREKLNLIGAYEKESKRLIKLRKEYKDLAIQNKQNTKEGKALLSNITKLDAKLKKVDASVGQNQRSVGKYSLALKNLGSQILGGLGITAAIGFLVNQFNKASERATLLNKSTNRLKGTFDLTTKRAKKLAIQINAISTNFEDADTQKLEISLNAIVKTFKDISESEALNLIQEGFQKGSNNSGEFLDILREYPAFFEKAGVSASEMFAIINQQVKDGVYSDKGVDSIKEATIQLTENTKIVKDALKPLGESVNLQIRQKVEAGKAFEAMQLITAEMEKLGRNSSEFQTIITDVFKGAGEDSENFVRNLHNVTLTLDDVAKQTSINEDANLRLSKSYNAFILSVSDGDGVISKSFANIKDGFASFLEGIQKINEERFGTKMEVMANGILNVVNAISFGGLDKALKNLTQSEEAWRFNTDRATSSLKIQKTEIKENARSVKVLERAEKKEQERLKKLTEQRKKDAKALKDNAAAVKKAAADQKKATEDAEKAEAGRLARNKETDCPTKKKIECKEAEVVATKTINDELEDLAAGHLTRLTSMNDGFRASEGVKRKADGEKQKREDIDLGDALLTIKDAAIGAAGELLADSFSFGIDAEVAAREEANNQEIEANEAQAEADKVVLAQRLEDNFITEKEFKTKSEAIDADLRKKNEKLEKDTKTQLAIADKKKALFDVGIATAVGIARVIPNPIAMALAAVLGGLQLAVVAARPIPKFADGGEVGGKPHSQGGTLAELERKEFVLSKEGYSGAEKIADWTNRGLLKDSDLDMMQNNDNYSYSLLQLNGLVDELRANGHLTRETNSILSKTVNMNEQGKMLAVRDYKGNIIRYEIIN